MRNFEDARDRGGRHRAPNSPRRPRVSKDPGERRQEIIETAMELLGENGYDNVSIQDITDRMHVSPGLCYRYFKSKTEIFAAASEYYAMKMVEQLSISVSQDISVIEKLKLVINRIYEFAMGHHDFEMRYSEGEDIRAIYLDKVAKQWSGVMIPILQQGVNEGVFHCKDITAAAQFLIFGLVHTFHQEMPVRNAEEHMASFLDFTYDMFSKVLGVPAEKFRR